MLTDIEELILKTRSDEAASYIREAYNCYNSRSYRSSIVACWIAVTFDFISKLKELAITGNGDANAEIDKFEAHQLQSDQGDNQQALKSALDFERNILEVVRDKFQLLDQHQYKDMLRLREDRYRCAHPAFHKNGVLFTPPAETCRLHIVNTLRHVLTQPPVQGKAALTSIVSVISSTYFPIEIDRAIVALKETELDKPSEALVNAIVDNIIFGIFTKDNVHFRKRKSRTALEAISRLHSTIAIPRILLNLQKIMKVCEDADMPYLLALVSDYNQLHDKLSDAQVVKFQNYIITQPKDFHANTVCLSLKISPLRDTALNAVKALTIDEISKYENFPEFDELVNRSVELFATASSWNAVLSAWNKVLKHQVNKIGKVHAERILIARKNREGDLAGSTGFDNFIECVYSNETKITKEELELLLVKLELPHLIRPVSPKLLNLDDVPF